MSTIDRNEREGGGQQPHTTGTDAVDRQGCPSEGKKEAFKPTSVDEMMTQRGRRNAMEKVEEKLKNQKNKEPMTLWQRMVEKCKKGKDMISRAIRGEMTDDEPEDEEWPESENDAPEMDEAATEWEDEEEHDETPRYDHTEKRQIRQLKGLKHTWTGTNMDYKEVGAIRIGQITVDSAISSQGAERTGEDLIKWMTHLDIGIMTITETAAGATTESMKRRIPIRDIVRK